ncbi:Fic family protein [Clostridium estertheticum]|uniref:Fic family protein n=1 Tax=Clostridium estertheticum TaxID=238834 RepID=UPI0021E29EED|nr:Fic family protein [Clostridium estertheticum]
MSKSINISERVIKDLHYIILKSIDSKNAGEYRKTNVLISGSQHRPVEHFLVHERMEELIGIMKIKINYIQSIWLLNFIVNMYIFIPLLMAMGEQQDY